MTEPLPKDTRSTRRIIAASLPRRYRAEQRFRAYGQGAIVLAVLALGLLLVSITAQGFSAFTIYRFSLPMTVTQKLVDPKGTNDPKVIAKGKYRRLIQNTLRRTFPDVKARKDVRALFALSTSLNAVDLRNRIVKNPALIGTTITYTAPVSDDLDLYLKGLVTPRRQLTAKGDLRVRSAPNGQVNLETQDQSLATAYHLVQSAWQAEAAKDKVRAGKLRQLATTGDPRRAPHNTAEAARLETRAAAREKAAQSARLTLSATDPSVFVRSQNSIIKITALGANTAVGKVFVQDQTAPVQTIKDWSVLYLKRPEKTRRINDRQIAWGEALLQRQQVKKVFNSIFFTHADSREPERAGIAGAMVGSLLTLLATMLAAVPVGIFAAIYLEEFAPKNRFTGFIEVNINNLAAVPSIIFGLLGLAVFLNVFHMPRSAPLVGGLVLALMTLPVVIIAARAAIKAVPPSIREAALGIGASKMQTVFHHVLPLAAPGIMTGTIIGLARALGETAPLLMIGMVAFIAQIPRSITAPSTAMPVQIYLWASSAERAWEARTAAAIIVLIGLMIALNLAAVLLRHKFERRW